VTTFALLFPAIPLWLRAALALLGGLAAFATGDLILSAPEPEEAAGPTLSRSNRGPLRDTALWGGLALGIMLFLLPWLGLTRPLRSTVAVLLVVTPGYLISLLILPERIDPLGRLVLSWALAAAILPIAMELLNVAGIAFSLGSVLVTLTTMIVALVLAVIYRERLVTMARGLRRSRRHGA